MSYTCRHQLTIITGDPTEEDVAGALEERHGKRSEGNFDWYDVLNRYAVDWKDREEAMLEVSLRWPQAVFVLDVQGEDQTQSVREFYRNGRTYTAEPVVPEFDPSLLDAGRGNREEREDRWVPDASIYAGLRARNVLDEALWDLNEGGGNYPEEDEIDRLAPSLRTLVMREIRHSELLPCRHAQSELADMGHDVVRKLPEHEREALRARMK